ncbi:MAG: LamG-like jellyroll fold domain-containing protein [Planctomycetota bacterium]
MKKTFSLVLILVLGMATELTNADFTFGEPTKVPNVNSFFEDSGPHISPDGLELYFHSGRPHGANGGCNDIWLSKRSTTAQPWSAPVMLDPPINSHWPQASPYLSADGLELYFTDGWPGLYSPDDCEPNPGGYGSGDLWVSRRATKEGPWGNPENLGPTVNSEYGEDQPSISSDGLSLYFMSNRLGGFGNTDLYVTTRQTKDDPWDKPVNLGNRINTGWYESTPHISPDGLSLFFAQGSFSTDIFVSRRTTTTNPWGQAVSFTPVNSPNAEYYLSFSTEDSTLYFCRSKDTLALADYDIWQVEVTPIVDLNNDGIVDAGDISIMIDYWHTDEPSCDIAPAPFGDGIVNVQDLVVLAENLFEDYRLDIVPMIAHWKLDETSGDYAYDSISNNNGTLHGDPIWQPATGYVGGALEFDGIDDYVSTPFILDPADGSFSVFAWIKGETPGQVIISQADRAVGRTVHLGSMWLSTEPFEGRLITRLMDVPFGALESESVITDGQWHHVGLVYDLDALHRNLYVDGVEVAGDSGYVVGVPSDGGLYIGAAKDLNTGSFFSGLIDDLRIYNRAVTP